jgi:hypothetical protein
MDDKQQLISLWDVHATAFKMQGFKRQINAIGGDTHA